MAISTSETKKVNGNGNGNVSAEKKPLNVLIIGAGIAGLAAAIALRKQGHDVVIIEKSCFATETGAAIHVPPNCTALLEWMGLKPAEFGGTLLQQIHRYNFDGHLEFQKNFDAVRQKWQAEWYLVHRIDLHNALKGAALAEDQPGKPVELHTACKVVKMDCENASVTLEDGRLFTADILLGADGVHSFTRGLILSPAQKSLRAMPVEKSVFRWLLPKQSLLGNPDTEPYVREPGDFIEWSAADRRLVAYPCSNDTILNLCAFLPSSEAGNGGEGDKKGWNSGGNKEKLVQGFADFCPGVKTMAAMAGSDLNSWQLLDMETLDTWRKGRAVLLGDSAHPFQPYMGQGGAMAIEDAVSLAVVLPLGTVAGEIPARLDIYEQARKPRAEQVVEYTRLNGRDENDVAGPRLTAQGMVEFMQFVFVHNEIEATGKALQAASNIGVAT